MYTEFRSIIRNELIYRQDRERRDPFEILPLKKKFLPPLPTEFASIIEGEFFREFIARRARDALSRPFIITVTRLRIIVRAGSSHRSLHYHSRGSAVQLLPAGRWKGWKRRAQRGYFRCRKVAVRWRHVRVSSSNDARPASILRFETSCGCVAAVT